MPARSNCIGRADLLRALGESHKDADARYADLLGFDRRPVEAEAEAIAVSLGLLGGELVSAPSDRPGVQNERPRLQASFFVVTHFDQRLESDPPEPEAAARVDASVQPLRDEDCAPRGEPLPFAPLVRRERLWPRLRQSLQQHWCAGVDLPRLVQQVASRRLAGRVPLREQQGLSRQIVVLWDAADRLTPYFEDYRRLVAELHRLHGGVSLRLWRVHEGPDDVWGEWDAARVAQPDRWPGESWHVSGPSSRPPGGALVPPGSRLLLLSDLGGLARHAGAGQRWLRALRRWESAGVQVTAWVPHGPAWVAPTLSALAEVHCLTPRLERLRRQRGGAALAQTEASDATRQRQTTLRDELLVRASVCLHLAPELLRSLRQTSPALAAEPGVEALAWASQPLVRGSHVSRTLSHEHAPGYRRRFAALDASAQCEILRRITLAHASLGRSIETTEVLVWQAHAHAAATRAERAAVRDAEDWARAWGVRMARDAVQGGLDGRARQFAADLLARLDADEVFMRGQADWASRLWVVADAVRLPVGLTAQDALRAQQALAPRSGDVVAGEVFWIDVTDHGVFLSPYQQGAMVLDARQRLGPFVEPGGVIDCGDGRLTALKIGEPVALAGRPGQVVKVQIGSTVVHLTELGQPDWASEWGRDQYGVFAVLDIQGVRQRMRYIPPGRFLMGSPDGVGHDDEHPQHEVVLTEGYWLADTLCTEALWNTVMSKIQNQTRHKLDTNDHPVRKVSLSAVNLFLWRLARLLSPGCRCFLPTEAQWEYAARAGTATAYWWGDEPDDSRANWSGQHQGTTLVNQYAPNPWGLHDMNGNVLEWCLDYRGAYTAHSVRDPCGTFDSKTRAVRGGAWFARPGNARSAYRTELSLQQLDHILGFRFALKLPVPASGTKSAQRRPSVRKKASR
jgi:hypothetical protein